MKKFLWCSLFLCLFTVARGQTGYEYDYWFDNDRSTLHTGQSSSTSWQIEADMSQLRETLHAIHVQVRDTAGVTSSPVTRFFVKTADRRAAQGRYWFDDNVQDMHTSVQMDGTFDLDVSSISEGFHTLHYQVVGVDGSISATASRSFYKVYMPVMSSWRCWFDNDMATVQSGKNPDQTILLDVSQLMDGYHVVHIQADGGADAVSTPITRPFIKTPQVIGVDYLTCLCMVDDMLYKQERVSANGGVLEWNFDVADIPQGFHRAYIQVVTPSGAATSAYSTYFIRSATRDELGEMKCVYAIDGGEYISTSGVISGQDYHFDIDVASLDDGLHRLTYMLNNGKGVSTKVQTQFFTKIPLGGNGITQYEYWLNQNFETRHKMTLPELVDPYNLISLLPVETEPIRSTCFHFEIKNGQPMMYAKNDIYLRFYEATGRFVDAAKQFVDYNVEQEVNPVGELLTTQTFGRVAENDIRWYTFEAEPGDTVAFCLSQAATLQVFTPSGKEVFNTSQDASVRWGGIHTWESGTHYLAVHDVTGSQSQMTLDYMHMDKYDVVDWDVHTVGNGGCSTITFKGNGFRDLYAVDLVIAEGDTIHSVDVSHDSDAESAVTFDFTGAELGEYNAVFHFTEEDKRVANVVTVEEAKTIELATEVTFPSSFGHVVTYTCKITNNGNMTAYVVPIYTWLKSKTLNGVYHIDYEGLDLTGVFDGIVTDSLTESEIADLHARSEELGDDHHFLKFWAEDEDNPGDSVFVRSNYFFTNISPYETKTLRLTISTREVDTYVYFTVPEDWPSYQVSQAEGVAGVRARFRAPSMKDKYCCIRNKVECFATLVADGVSIANTILQYAPDVSTQVIAAAADCVAGAASKIISTAGTVMCDDNSVEKNFWDKVNAALDGTSTVGTLSSCLSQLLPWKKVKAILDGIGNIAGGTSTAFGLGVDMANCAIAFTSKVPGCPPDPPGGGGAQGGRSHDPNDIYGYQAESGGKFMTDKVEKVNYRIEFENDTAFATRSAIVVEIRDTLDEAMFDLSSYEPTGIKIGEKVEYLDGKQSFVKTMDMRPEINGLVEVEGNYEAQKGVMTWLFTSLDPMTMEPTNDPMQGFLPVNYNGTSGIGEISYNVKLKQRLTDGTEVPNRASIMFDINEPILTPTWVNTVDAVAPTSRVESTTMEKADTVTLHLAGEDARSGLWRYTVYVQDGGSAPWREVGRTDTCVYDFAFEEGIDYGFCVLATDSAGNVEQKELTREATLRSFIPGDANGDEVVDTKDAILVLGYYLGQEGVYLNASAADIVEDGVIDTKDAIAIINQYLNSSAGVKQKKTRKRIRVL